MVYNLRSSNCSTSSNHTFNPIFFENYAEKNRNFFLAYNCESQTRVKQRVEKLTAVATHLGGFLAPLPGRTFCNDRTPGFAIAAPGAIDSSPYRGIGA